MKIVFYLGVVLAIAGLFIYSQSLEFRNLGILLVCLGVAAVVIGFGGLILNALIDNAHYKKKSEEAKGSEVKVSETEAPEVKGTEIEESEVKDSDKPQN